MNVPVRQELRLLNTIFSTALRGRAEGEAAGLLQGPGEDSGLCPGEQALDLDSMTTEI